MVDLKKHSEKIEALERGDSLVHVIKPTMRLKARDGFVYVEGFKKLEPQVMGKLSKFREMPDKLRFFEREEKCQDSTM